MNRPLFVDSDLLRAVDAVAGIAQAGNDVAVLVIYDMVGMEVTGLDGFYPDVFPVYGDYGIRIPENPSGVCNEIYEKTGVRAMIVDANDFTRDILGKGDNVTLTDEQLCEIIRDNPAGQDDQCTPFILIRKKQ